MEDDNLREIEGKLAHDPHHHHFKKPQPPSMIIVPKSSSKNGQQPTTTRAAKIKRYVLVSGPVIVGAGPSGLAAAACLKEKGVPSLILERSDCIASLWQYKTYDRLHLHLPKQFCELPLMPFPKSFPTYPTKEQFVHYLEEYANRFDIRPVFNESVSQAKYDRTLGFWRVTTTKTTTTTTEEEEEEEVVITEYVCRSLVVATGENAEEVVPDLQGKEEFGGPIVHTSSYKSGHVFNGKKVLVVGCGNSGMEVCLDLCHHNAMPSIVVRDTVHILPREMLGISTFGLSMWLLKWLPITLVDHLLLFLSWLMLGDPSRFGLLRPKMGPLQLKNMSGKTPVLDVGTLHKIKRGHVKVCPGIRRLKNHAVEFTNGRTENFDAIVLATGYKSNVPYWLKENEMFSEKDGLPRRAFPNGWKGEYGLYAVGFTKRGLLGASMDAKRIAEDIQKRMWTTDSKHFARSLNLSSQS